MVVPETDKGGPKDEFAGDLIGIFRQYNIDKNILRRLFYRTGLTFSEVKMKLAKDIKDDKFKKSLDQTIMYHDTLHKVDRVINQIPSIIFIGQTKSGKSSLINEILEATVVAVDQRPCTARLVQLEYTHHDKPCVMIVDKAGNILEKKTLTKKYIPSEWINLPHEQRQKEEIVTQKVIAQVKNAFLESGVRIIDSPGQDENPLLDKLVMGHLETILPLIVYVIDGRNLVTTKDIEDIRTIQSNTPSKNIFFVVSKLDCNEEADTSESSYDDEEDDDDDDREERVKQQENKIMQMVFNRLCREGILDKDIKMEECDRIYGLSAWRIKEDRRLRRELEQSKKKKRPANRFTTAFEVFKRQLVRFSKVQLNYFVETAAETLAKIHQGCINFFIDEANRIYNDNSSYDTFILNVREREDRLVKELKAKIEEEQGPITGRIRKFLLGIKSKVVSDAGMYPYKDVNAGLAYAMEKAAILSVEPSAAPRDRMNSLYAFEQLGPLLLKKGADERESLDWIKAESNTEPRPDNPATPSPHLSPDAPQLRTGSRLSAEVSSCRSSAEIDFDVPLGRNQNGGTTGGSNDGVLSWDFLSAVQGDTLVTDMRVVVECQNQIRRFTREKVGLGLSNMIWDDMIRPGGVLDTLAQTAKGFDIAGASDDPATVLRNLIHEHYEYRYNPEIEKMEMNFKRRIRNGMKRFLTSLTDMPQTSGGVGNIPVNQREWKEQIAREAFIGVKAEEVMKEIVLHLKDHVQEGHEQFKERQEMVDYVYRQQCLIGKQNRQTIRDCAPKIAELEVRSLDLIHAHRYNPFTPVRNIGMGAQCIVQTIDKLGPNGEVMVVKRREVMTIQELQQVALEVHHTRNVDHPNLAKLHGCTINYCYQENQPTKAEMCLFYKQEEGDLLYMIANRRFPELTDRLVMALQVAEAVKYLHDKNITHRDIKGANVLVDPVTNHVTLTDFGHMKPFGLTAETICGTPGFMAPELLEKGLHAVLCPAVDIYAFGIFLWYIVDGTGFDPFMSKGYLQVFEETKNGVRPPLNPSYPKNCVDLMTSCWQTDPNKRPFIKDLVIRLKEIIEGM
ncbi:uncharacterized protein LOC135490870 [Lineus longissimus]|uniref:uncharacterized protein LOC135490870 n=1 Tax=Lineus longissimus TaxID=88925 RepID=UPI002B4CA7B2